MKDSIASDFRTKYIKLQTYLRSLGSVAVAFSGGVDSTFLLKAAHDTLGDKVIAITAKSCAFPKREEKEANAFCLHEKIRQILIESDEMNIPEYRRNQNNRCYYCKKALFQKIKQCAEENGIAHVAEGSNSDDLGDYRPGLRAIEELQIRSPLREVGLTKKEIRTISQELGLSVWNKPSFACLASRIPYGDEITPEKLNRIERAEQLLFELGFRQFRVRMHGDLARIEIEQDQFEKMLDPDIRIRIEKEFKAYGFSYISLDLEGYRTGSMNEVIERSSL